MRIGLATPAWPGTAAANGIASATAHLAAGLQAIGHEVTILAHHVDAPSDHPRVVDASTTPMSLSHRLLFKFAPDRAIRRHKLRQLVAAAKQAVASHRIELLMMEESFGWAAEVRRALTIPVAVTLHGPQWLHRTEPSKPDPGPDARRESWEAAGLQGVDGIISPSLDVLDRTRKLWGLPDVPTTIIGNPIEIRPLSVPAANITTPHLLFVGRFDRIKGADVLFGAFVKLCAAHPSCRLTFVGPDGGIAQPDGSIRQLADVLAELPLNIRDRIEVLGRRTREEIAEIRKRHPITLITSRYETFGVALIEAMAAGSAVISTSVGGCAEILHDGETGLLIPAEDPTALAEACLKLLGDQELVQRLGSAARADVAARFAPDVIARQVAAFLALLCRSRN